MKSTVCMSISQRPALHCTARITCLVRSTAMSKVAVVAGYGPAIGAAFAKKFGSAGYSLALLSLAESMPEAAAAELTKAGMTAKGYTVDLSNPAAVKAAIVTTQQDLGPTNLLFWNPVGPSAPFQTATPDQTISAFNTTVTGLMAAVQAAHADLRATQGAVLVTGGGVSLETDAAASLAEEYGASTLAVSKAAQRKLVHIMHKGLGKEGIYVAELTVAGMVRGTPYDPQGTSRLTPEGVADAFWELLQKRDPAVWFAMKTDKDK